MATPKDMLELRLDHAATPERVARATRLLADLLAPIIGGDDDGESVDPADADFGEDPLPAATIVVNNLDMRATVKVYRRWVEPALEEMANFIHNPESEDVPETLTTDSAKTLLRYAREEARFHPSFWMAGPSPRRLRTVDESFADEVEKATKTTRRSRRSKVVGTTFITSKIYKVGRNNDDSPTKARVLLPSGTWSNLRVAESAIKEVTAAFDAGREYRIKLVGDWVNRDGGLELEYNNRATIIAVDDRVGVGNTEDLRNAVAESPAIRKGELAGVLRYLRGDDEEE